MSTVGQLGETAVLAWIRGQLDHPHPHVSIGIGDDAAVLSMPGRVVATVDSITAGVDWLPGRTPRQAVGHRAAAVNLSDLAAMGATPAALLLSLELPNRLPMSELQAAIEGLCALCDLHGVAVAGGDIGMGTGPEHWSVTALGHLCGDALQRDTARDGDRVWLVGEVGAAAVGLGALSMDAADRTTSGIVRCLQAHLWPVPLVEAGKRLQRAGRRVAAIDLSDGLWLDAARLAEASGVGMDLTLPRPDWCDADTERTCVALGLDWRQGCASGGDDYALLLTAPADFDVARALKGLKLRADPIGSVREAAHGPAVSLVIDGRAFVGPPRGHLHGDR